MAVTKDEGFLQSLVPDPAGSKKRGKKGGSEGYTAENITVLEGLEPVRVRPGMPFV